MKKLICMLLTVVMLIPMMSVYAAELPFEDVEAGSWYEGAVAYCYENGLMKGTGDTTFSPKGTVTREQFVQALAQKEGVDLTAYAEAAEATPFTDVPAGKWYSNAIEWARANEIVTGTSATTFGLGNKVTREQMATMFARYADGKGQKIDYAADLDSFGDKDSISSWALDGVNYAVAVGLFQGNDKGNFAPQGQATRMELATVLQRVNVRAENRILCWGDSLTMGIETGWGDFVDIPYAERLGEYLGVESVNLGIGSETSDMIAMRQGGIPVYVEGITIPADCTPVEIAPMIDGSDEVSPFGLYGFEGINECEIAGVKGRLTDEHGGNGSRWNTAVYFTRTEPGEAVEVTERTRIITKYMMDKREDDVLVIWIGSNDLYGANDTSLFDTIVANQQAIIDYAGTDEYIIVGYTADMYIGNNNYRTCVDDFNALMAEQWGDKFLNVKAYMGTEQCLADHEIEPTEQDIEFLNKGWIPPSLLEDSANLIHFNQLGYDIVADMVAEKIVELGYLN
ncbi:MAG: hypothetical protein E7652_07480 [Ruminococcaceae bacterium]|nr:hypothetical protein [Oscillospiraceae bacterium]